MKVALSFLAAFAVSWATIAEGSQEGVLFRQSVKRGLQEAHSDHDHEAESLYACDCDGDIIFCLDVVDENVCHCDNGVVHCEEDEKIQDGQKPWAEVIVASLIVNAVTLIGVIFIAGEWLRKFFFPTWKSGGGEHRLWTHILIPQFACGALLATTFFLVLPEALLLIQADLVSEDGHEGHNHRRYLQEEDDHSGESAATWRFGSAILGGFLIPVFGHLVFPHSHTHEDDGEEEKVTAAESEATEEDQEKESKHRHSDHTHEFLSTDKISVHSDQVPEAGDNTSSDNAEATSEEPEKAPGRFSHLKNFSLMSSIFIGDFMHNFADGVFLGTSFLLCSRELALTIAAATIFHELAQEVADYFMLVHHCGMRPFGALAFNFVCGLSIMLGGLLVLIVNLSSTAVGSILCVGGGVYVHVAVAECLCTAQKAQKTRKQQAYGILAFITGAVPIGLVLLNHQHCGDH
mmetsp:Transcript_9388/g.16364  ORF Transcript_9388/g.16364 Transcript_9388/m.16364 type:complete len:461 (-) Transcript_9388:157-1539(-)|eukprot:CAMPEP_0178838086 /NCGR_PEP_ID=MMETSP0746-20121128/13110_1 /TAXON_ID=913974 /ORGANISM="Nitzschia punctata, Strain CCMP561" /LENGTH=460 /DNA_ID=CAMNT_0020500979 /DNA_START=127 /DNA_END=1509 /DNA_ORIENTATION=+